MSLASRILIVRKTCQVIGAQFAVRLIGQLLELGSQTGDKYFASSIQLLGAKRRLSGLQQLRDTRQHVELLVDGMTAAGHRKMQTRTVDLKTLEFHQHLSQDIRRHADVIDLRIEGFLADSEHCLTPLWLIDGARMSAAPWGILYFRAFPARELSRYACLAA
jgi:hypothetical protein